MIDDNLECYQREKGEMHLFITIMFTGNNQSSPTVYSTDPPMVHRVSLTQC